MNIFTVTILAVILCFSLTVIKQIRPEYAAASSAVVCIALASGALICINPLMELILSEEIISNASEHLKTVLKGLGIALLCSVAIEVCKSFGENAMAFGIELFCKCEIIALSVPLIIEVIKMSKDMLLNEI